MSLSLTLLVWGPNAIDGFGHGSVNLGDLALRFVVTFAFFRMSVWGIGQLIDSYRSSTPRSKEVARVSPPSRVPTVERRTSRRSTVGEVSVVAELELPGLPEAR